jgi:hypothetical protein
MSSKRLCTKDRRYVQYPGLEASAGFSVLKVTEILVSRAMESSCVVYMDECILAFKYGIVALEVSTTCSLAPGLMKLYCMRDIVLSL